MLLSAELTATEVQTNELSMLSDDGPPHMIAASNSGIDIDITREILNSMGYKVTLDFMPLARGKSQVQLKYADLFLPTFYQQDSEQLFYSDAIIEYRPVILSLKKNQFSLNELSDADGKKILTFQGATGYFGEEFVKLSKGKGYRELADMSKFPELLLWGRYDLVVLDYYIFYYFLKRYCQSDSIDEDRHDEAQITKLRYCRQEIEEHNLLLAVSAHVGFNDAKLRNDFNKALERYKRAKIPQKVIKKYIGSR
ncbi:substrate-binding periplasmic protein [Thalassotalea atypica]|uniref:substrate-binding periplasmic protein n=1 Tax=Thalassotalea atypica TaxID=2054316 RepID=UPI002573822B|nr:transporter substrate-binding domain-containing protein [Thalassotalea atypica]